MVLELNKDNFDSEVLKADQPVIVDFWAPWCGPCMMMAPVFEEVSKDYEGKLKFTKLNVDEFGDTAGTYDISGIPCLVIFKNGKEVDRIVGMNPKEEMKSKIDSIL